MVVPLCNATAYAMRQCPCLDASICVWLPLCHYVTSSEKVLTHAQVYRQCTLDQSTASLHAMTGG